MSDAHWTANAGPWFGANRITPLGSVNRKEGQGAISVGVEEQRSRGAGGTGERTVGQTGSREQGGGEGVGVEGLEVLG